MTRRGALPYVSTAVKMAGLKLREAGDPVGPRVVVTAHSTTLRGISSPIHLSAAIRDDGPGSLARRPVPPRERRKRKGASLVDLLSKLPVVVLPRTS